MIVQDPVLVPRAGLKERERQADEDSSKRRRCCFIFQVVAGILCFIPQLVDAILFYGSTTCYDRDCLTRRIVPGIWSGLAFAAIGGLHLYWKPETTSSLIISTILHFIALATMIALAFFVMWPLIHRDLRMNWSGYVVYVYGFLMVPMCIEAVTAIMSLQLTASKLLRSQGYLEEGTRDHSLLNQRHGLH